MFLSNGSRIIPKLYREYQRHSGIMLPLLVLNSVLIFVDKIPYLNLIGTSVSTFVLIITVVSISVLYRKTRVFTYLLSMLLILWVLSALLKLNLFQEAIGSSIYVLTFWIICWYLYLQKVSTHEGISHIDAQRKLFNQEFSKIETSSLAQWQQSYLTRIKKYLLIDGKKNAKIIELGCGDGKISIATAKLGHKLTACDISDASIRLTNQFAKKEHVQIQTAQCDVTKLPFKDGSFDYAIAGAILEHLEDEDAALKEWNRVLKTGGRIMIVTPLRQRHVLPIWWVLNWFHDRRLGHVRRYDRRRYEALSRYGFHLTQVLYTGHTPKVFMAILHILTKQKSLEVFAERVDIAFEKIEYDGNNIIGFFVKQ